MRIRQYAELVIVSEIIGPDEVTGALLLEPSRVSLRGTRSTDPMIPRFNVWTYRARGDGTVDELVRELVDLCEPLGQTLRGLAANHACSVSFSVLRSFDDPDGVEDDGGSDDLPPNLVRLPGQHQLVGFHLDPGLMRRLVDLNLALDVDEYA